MGWPPTRADRRLGTALAAALLAGAAARAQEPEPSPSPPVTRQEVVTVTGSRGAPSVGGSSADVTVLDRARLDATAAPALDDALREVAGFALFRRAGSRVANPTAQGVSLRGTGASGASRAVVLWDGLPLTDPFGGWVAWSRVPLLSLERVEVVEGGVSSLYGSGALGGVVQALSRRDAPAAAAELSAGDAGQASAAFFASARRGRSLWRAAGEARTFGGYVIVPEDARGPVDTDAGARHLTGSAAWELRPTEASRLTLTGSAFGESRRNGTPVQSNDTSLRAAAAAWTASGARLGTLDASAWWQSQTYHQAFSAVAPGRASEALTRLQRVPSKAIGVGVVWSRATGTRAVWSAGADARRTDGRSDETPFAASRPGVLVSAGGRETVAAAFVRAQVAASDRVTLAAGARFDRWRSGARSDRRLSPQIGASFRATDRLQVVAGSYGAFRAPTLNERYRSFRVGDTLTLAEPGLAPERLAGAELGLAWSAGRSRARATLFAARIDDPVASRTLQVEPMLVTRRRANLGRTSTRGVSLDVEGRIGPLQLSAGYTGLHARVDAFADDPALVGRWLPQVPRHQAVLGARAGDPRALSVSLLVRGSTRQFEDDRNAQALAGYVTADLRASRRFGRVDAFAVCENVTGVRYDVGRLPTPTVGPPRLVRGGIRIGWAPVSP
ncbi:MAG: TonB-dependent receptor [Vicinamibacteria bacterium]